MKLAGILIGMFFCLALGAQPANTLLKDPVKYDKTLQNRLFTSNDTLKDSIWIKGGLDWYFNKPINAHCITSGDLPPGEKDSLIFCTAEKEHDTLLIHLSSPSACCYTDVTVMIVHGRFMMSSEFSYDIAPQLVLLRAQKEQLTLRNDSFNKGELLEGYLYFEGKGTYKEPIAEDAGIGVRINREFNGKVEGYFKCRIE
ncbi:MAG TPA: hypothetical protein VNZ86_18600 [Bacteroidia bacterium]|jgi:hypothetical protein|nr:hypothetical protein [Bacteroidia bacterium]